jgi:FtsZ-binding cell division protein ZapB
MKVKNLSTDQLRSQIDILSFEVENLKNEKADLEIFLSSVINYAIDLENEVKEKNQLLMKYLQNLEKNMDKGRAVAKGNLESQKEDLALN